jgi:hypothetical protein
MYTVCGEQEISIRIVLPTYVYTKKDCRPDLSKTVSINSMKQFGSIAVSKEAKRDTEAICSSD